MENRPVAVTAVTGTGPLDGQARRFDNVPQPAQAVVCQSDRQAGRVPAVGNIAGVRIKACKNSWLTLEFGL